MCEINPKHSAFFRLEVFTSNPYTSKEEFDNEIAMILLETEMKLNELGKFRFHIHEEEPDIKG